MRQKLRELLLLFFMVALYALVGFVVASAVLCSGPPSGHWLCG